MGLGWIARRKVGSRSFSGVGSADTGMAGDRPQGLVPSVNLPESNARRPSRFLTPGREASIPESVIANDAEDRARGVV